MLSTYLFQYKSRDNRSFIQSSLIRSRYLIFIAQKDRSMVVVTTERSLSTLVVDRLKDKL